MRRRYQTDSEVQEKQKRQARTWAKKNKKRRAELNREWSRANVNQVHAQQRRWRQANPEKSLNRQRLWKAANPGAARKHYADRRAREKAATVPLTPAEQAQIATIYAEAARRTAETGVPYQVDHDKPLARGGVHHPKNLLVVPASLNQSKGARYDSTLDFILS